MTRSLLGFSGPIPWTIEIAVILSGVVRHWPDFLIILVLLISNAWSDFGKNARPPTLGFAELIAPVVAPVGLF